jgi:hypothetical protein
MFTAVKTLGPGISFNRFPMHGHAHLLVLLMLSAWLTSAVVANGYTQNSLVVDNFRFGTIFGI